MVTTATRRVFSPHWVVLSAFHVLTHLIQQPIKEALYYPSRTGEEPGVAGVSACA